MDSTAQELSGILLRAIPTIIFLVLLHWYLKLWFFRPLQQTLQKRREATEGARLAAEASLKHAENRAAEYEAKLREARAQISQEQESLHKSWTEEQTKSLDEARHQTHELLQNARRQIDEQAVNAKRSLAADAEGLANEIAASLLNGRPH